MELTKEQIEFIKSKQLDSEKTLKVANVVGTIAQDVEQKYDLEFNPKEAEQIFLISNIGQMHPDMTVDGASIYSKDYGPWDDRAKQLNSNRGNYSIQMAEEQGIELTQSEKETIEGTTRGKASNLMGVVIKSAQTFIAVQSPRYNYGQKKEAAKNFNEIQEYLKETFDEISKQVDIDDKIIEAIIQSAKGIYDRQQQKSDETKNTEGKVDHGDIGD